jgi:signal transduction protein with GAF and PtsI domain
MFEAPRNEVQRLQTLLDTVRLLNSTLEIEELTAIILEVVRAEIAVERISVFLVDRSQNILRPLVAQELDDDEIALPVGVGIAGTVAATGEVLDVPEAYADPRFDRRFDGKSGFYTNDIFALPVCNRSGDVVGVLELLNRLRPISPADREFLLGISVYIGLALENSFLHSQIADLPETRQQDREELDYLSFAVNYLQLLPEEHDLPDPAWTFLQAFNRGFTDATFAAVKFKDAIRRQRQTLASVNLSDELRRLSQSRAEDWERFNIKAMLVAETAPPVYVHEQDMRLVLSFLIRSAEAAIVQMKSERQLRIHSWCNGKNVNVSIHHRGPIDDLLTSSGFRFASSLVQQDHGQIRVESDSGKGTTFVIELPVHHESRLTE